jgi:drug/metabolite transporter (DMT)-like permease
VGQTLSLVFSGLAALVGGLLLAITGLLHQRAASQRPKSERFSLQLIRSLARNRLWLIGLVTIFASYGFQAIALALGPLAFVQPLIVSELIFAVPVSVRLRGLRIGAREWAAVAAVIIGLTLGLASAVPHGGDPLQPVSTWVYGLAGVTVVAGASVLLGRWIRGPVRASLFALAGATVLGCQSALFSATIALLRQDLAGTFSAWQPYVLIVASLLGGFLVQNAYQAGPLAASMPVMDAALPLTGIALGVGIFGEQIRTGALALTGTATGLILLLVGIVLLDTSPLVRREQRIERAEREQTARQEAAREDTLQRERIAGEH